MVTCMHFNSITIIYASSSSSASCSTHLCMVEHFIIPSGILCFIITLATQCKLMAGAIKLGLELYETPLYNSLDVASTYVYS